VAVNEKLVGLAPTAGGTGAAVTVNVTGTVTLAAPVAVRVIVPLWVAAVRVPVATVSVTAALPVPDVDESVNQGVVSLACQVRVPPPVLLMLRV
jgi:hypothetical protein